MGIVHPPKDARITLVKQAHTALVLLKQLHFHKPSMDVAPNTGAAVGLLALRHFGWSKTSEATLLAQHLELYANSIMSPSSSLSLPDEHAEADSLRSHSVELLDWTPGQKHDARVVLDDLLGDLDEEGTSVFDDLYRVKVKAKPSWLVLPGPQAKMSEGTNYSVTYSPPSVILLYLLYTIEHQLRLEEHLGIGDDKLLSALSTLYILSFSLTNDGAPVDWSPETWSAQIGKHVKSLHQYVAVKEMLTKGTLSGALLDGWATWLVQQPGYRKASRKEAHEVAAAMEKFLDKVVYMVLPTSLDASLGKSLPVGMSVFHPNSARRRAHAGRF
ncbi:hypothetical protein JCM9279_000536 [Rhodotorula babjevae]